MTIGQLKETLLGKVLLEIGLFGDGTSFGDLDVSTISEQLQKLNYESYGNEIMYDGLTGEQMEASIFIGPVFYQNLYTYPIISTNYKYQILKYQFLFFLY